MARQRYYHDPSRKHIEAYQDFSGGLNTVSSNDNTSQRELKMLKNIDLGERGSLKRRKGYQSEQMTYEDEGEAQGYWRYSRRYVPYNLIGIEGAFDGEIRYVGNKERVGSWIGYNMHSSEHIYKIEREEAENITVNPQFENGDEGWRFNIPEDRGRARIWHNTDTEGADRVMYIQKYEGVRGYLGEYQQPVVPTEENEEFYVEVMVRRPNYSGHPKAPQKAHLGAYIFKEDGTSEYKYIHTDFDIKVSWKKLSGFFKMPKGATGVRFGLGISDYTNSAAGAYFDLFHARRKAVGTDNGAVAITSEILPDHNKWGGIGYNFDIEPNKYYIALVDYSSDGEDALGAMEVYDRRFGLESRTRHRFGASDEWTTQYFKFQTHEGMTTARMNLYNRTYPSNSATVFYDSARIYEVTPEIYEKIDNDPEYTGESLVVRFPYRTGILRTEVIHEEVVAKGGKFYINGVEKKVEGDIPIQDERIMDAAMYKNNMYIASGTRLLVYNGSTIAPVEPYIPTPLEALYVGSNALSDSPFEVVDQDSEVLSVNQVMFSHRYGITNKFLTVSVGVTKPHDTNKKVEYLFERRRSTDKQGYWFKGQDWSEENEYTFSTDIAGEYQFRISVRYKGDEQAVNEYIIPKYIIKPNEDEGDLPIDAITLDTCNRILVHWDRLILYGDSINQDIMYISDLQNPHYFPVNNTLQFENPRKERITSIKRYRDNLVIFTPSSIQALFGTNPENFQRVMLNTDYGCIADRSAEVMENGIAFLSYEGVALLKTVGTSESRANVSMIDVNIKNLVSQSEKAVSYLLDNQYCLVFPDEQKQLRFYYEHGVWTMDESPSLDMVDVVVENGELYAIGKDGRLITRTDDYQDEGVPFRAEIETKFYFFGETYSVKKTRELQIMIERTETETELRAITELDSSGVIANEVINIEPGEEVYKMMIPGKGLGGKFTFIHEENKEFQLVGIGVIFKLKKP